MNAHTRIPTEATAASSDLVSAVERQAIIRRTLLTAEISFNAMQVARWGHPFDERNRHQFFREHRARKMREAGLPMLEQDKLAMTPVKPGGVA